MKLVVLASLLLLALFVKRSDAAVYGQECDDSSKTCTGANQACVPETCNKCRCIIGFHQDPADALSCIPDDARTTVASVTTLMTSLFFVLMIKKYFV